MRKTETAVGKGFTLQTLRAMELFLDAIDESGKDAKIFVSTENKGDINLNVNGQEHIGESKNYKTSHSFNSKEILNTLVNFIDVYIISEANKTISFGFYSTADKKNSDNFKLPNSILNFLETKSLSDPVIEIVKSKVIEQYKAIYKNRESNILSVEKLSNEKWKDFLFKIDWKFNLEGNQELNENLRKRIKESPILKEQEDFNGIENSIVLAFKKQLEDKQESKNILQKCFNYSDFESIIYKEMFFRQSKSDLGEFKELSKAKQINEIKISYDKFFFTKKEKDIISYITNQFKYSADKRFALINGNRAQGKTILAVKIGLEIEKEKYKILFLELDAQSSSDILLSLRNIHKKHTDVLCIITKCHLNLNLFKKIVNDSTEYPNIRFLFESNILHNEHIEDDLDFLNNIETSTLSFTEEDFQEKYCGIVNTYFPKVLLSNQFVNTLISVTGRNFVYLFELLELIGEKDFKSITEVATNKIKQKVKEEFLKKFEKNKRLIDYAIINQYEIYFNCSNDERELWFKDLLNKDSVLVKNTSRTDYYRFYHSDFAKLIVNTNYEIKNLNKSQQNLYEKTVFLEYFSSYNLNEIRVDGIFRVLYSNSAKQLLGLLLTDEIFRKQVFEYYKTSDNFSGELFTSKPLRDLLMYVNEVCPSYESEYLSALVLENNSIGELLKGDASFILTLIKISTYLKNSLSTDYQKFANGLSFHLKNIPTGISFSAITYYLSAANRADKILFGLLSDVFTDIYLINSIEEEEFLTLTEGLGCLYQVYNTSNEFIESIPFKTLSHKAEGTTLKRFSKGLQNLESLNRKKLAVKIFANYSDILFKEKLQSMDLKEALSVANILKNYGYEKVYKTFTFIKFSFNASLYIFTELVLLLNEVNEYLENTKLATEFINSIDFSETNDNVLNENPYLVARYLHSLSSFKGYSDKANEIYKSIPNYYFANHATEINFFKLCELLHWLNKLERPSNKKTNEIFKSIDMNSFQMDIENEDFFKIILCLKNLYEINPITTKDILTSNEKVIFDKLGKPNYNQIGISLIQLSEVNPITSFKFLKLVLSNPEFKEWIISKPLQEISRTLKEFYKIEEKINTSNKPSIVRKFYYSLNETALIQNAKKDELRFDLLCSAMHELHSLCEPNSKKAEGILSCLGYESLINKISEYKDFFMLAQGFSNLSKVSSIITSTLFEKSLVILVNHASNCSLENFALGIKSFAKLGSDKAALIYTNSNLNLKNIAETIQNNNLDDIKKCVSFLKPHSPSRTKDLVQEFSTENLAFKFSKERNFDKATEYLSQLNVANEQKIHAVVDLIGADPIYQRCKNLEIKLVAQGLSKIFKIHEVIAQTVMHKILSEREIKKELAKIPQFADLTQKLSVIKKISTNNELLDEILNFISVPQFVKRAQNSSAAQLSIGFGSLNQVNFNFSKKVAQELCKISPKCRSIFYDNKELFKLLN